MMLLWGVAAGVIVAVIIILSIIVVVLLVTVYGRRLLTCKDKSSTTDSQDELTTPTTDKYIHKGQTMDPEPCYIHSHKYLMNPSNSIYSDNSVTLRIPDDTQFVTV